MTKERVVAGLAAARLRGRVGGRPPAITGEKLEAISTGDCTDIPGIIQHRRISPPDLQVFALSVRCTTACPKRPCAVMPRAHRFFSRYKPQYGGYCANAMTKGKLNDIDPTAFFIYKGKLYVCTGAKELKTFKAKPDVNIKKADKKWEFYQPPSIPGYLG